MLQTLTPEQVQLYLALLQSAYALGEQVYEDVRGVLHKRLTPEENQQVLAVWQDNERRSAANAGLT